MSGEIYIEKSGWADRLAAALICAPLCGGGIWLLTLYLMRRGVEGLTLTISSGVLVLVLWWGLYPSLHGWIKGRRRPGPTRWEIRDNDLLLGEDMIPLESIRQVHCWQNRTALGYTAAGWTVNIETTGKNRMLRSDAGTPQSEEGLRALVEALGYGQRWRPQV